jgi:hypothetical protein
MWTVAPAAFSLSRGTFSLFEAVGGEDGYFFVVELHGFFSRSKAPDPAMAQVADRSSLA